MIIDARSPALLGAVTATLFGLAAALMLMPHRPWDRLRAATRWSPRVLGAIGGVLVALLVGITSHALLGTTGLAGYFTGALVLLAGLVVGVYLPGTEARRHARRQQRLRVQAIDFAGYLVRALAGSAGEVALLREYTRRPRPQVADVQAIVDEVVTAHQRSGAGSVWDMLHTTVKATGSQQLADLTGTMMEVARHDRRQVIAAIDAQRQQLLQQLIAQHERRAQRNELIILGVSAGALFFGLLLGLLYVMTGGLTVLTQLGL